MSYYNDYQKSTLKFICGEYVHICRLCFSSTLHQEVSLQDTVIVVKPYCNETVTFSEMLGNLGNSVEPLLPQGLCATCASDTINSYIFQKLCQYSDLKWKESLDTLAASLTETEVLSPNVHSAFLILNKNSHITLKSRKTDRIKSKKAVLSQIKEIMESRVKYLKRKSKPVEIACGECGEHFSSCILLNRHKKLHTKITCSKCPKKFSTSNLLQRHSERMHTEKKFRCKSCPKMYNTEKMFQLHTIENHEAVTCKLCLVEFPSRKSLREHSDFHETNACPRCLKEFNKKNSYKVHVRKCGISLSAQFYCDLCHKGYINKNGMKYHLAIAHGFGKVMSCDWCDKKFAALNRLKTHMIKHTRERNFSCDQCGGLFRTRAALMYHSRLHTGEKPYQCDLCDETFISASRRTEHKKRKHIGPTKECSVCSAKFVTRHQLHKHKARHYNPDSKLYIGKDIESPDIICTIVDE